MTRYARISSPLGTLVAIAQDEALAGLHFEGARHAPAVSPQWREEPERAVFEATRRQLAEYFDGKRRAFELPLAGRGTAFQRRVWEAIARIGYGQTITYAELAANACAIRAIRAAGAATGRNPFTLIVPCHRVVGADGSLTGYAGGTERKARLLALEKGLA